VDDNAREDPNLGQFEEEDIIMADWCFMCKRSRKCVDHLLLHCEVENYESESLVFLV
jgi:hypothetical protein